MENKNVEKIKSLPKGVLYDLKEILEIIEVVLLYNRPKPFTEDYFKMEHFEGIREISVLKILKMLDSDFNIINFHQRNVHQAVHIGLKNEEDQTEFQDFFETVKRLCGQSEIIKKIYIVKKPTGYSKAVINEDYSKPITISRANYWRLLIKIAEEKTAIKTFYGAGYDQLVNKSRFPFKNYDFSKIVKSEDRIVHSLIDIKLITQEEFENKILISKM